MNYGDAYFYGDALMGADNLKVKFGASQDASMYYDGTNLIIKSDDVGSGVVKLTSAGHYTYQVASSAYSAILGVWIDDSKAQISTMTNDHLAFTTNDGADVLTIETDESINVRLDMSSPGSTGALTFGAGYDAYIGYDGTNLEINPKRVGTGYLSVLGAIVQSGAGAQTLTVTSTDQTSAGILLQRGNYETDNYTDFKLYASGGDFLIDGSYETSTTNRLHLEGSAGALGPLTLTTGNAQYGFKHTDGTKSFGTYIGTSGTFQMGTVSDHGIGFFTNDGADWFFLDKDYSVWLYKDIASTRGGRMWFGAAGDASIGYDGTNLIVAPAVVGSGYLDIRGDTRVQGLNAYGLDDQVVMVDDEIVFT